MAADLTKEQIKQAKDYYLNPTIAIKDVRSLTGLTVKQLSNLVKEGGWDVLRNSKKVTKSHLLQSSYQQLDAIHTQVKNNGYKASESTIRQEALILKKIEQFSDHHLSYFIDIGLEFIDFLSSKDPEFAVKVGEHYDSFITYKSKNTGGH